MTNQTNAVAIPSTQTFQDRIRDRIRTMMFDSLTESELDAMLAQCLDEFMHGPRNKRFLIVNAYFQEGDLRIPTAEKKAGNYQVEGGPDPKYNPSEDPNTLPGMLYRELRTMAVDLVKEHVAKMKHNTTEDYSTIVAGQPVVRSSLESAIQSWLNENGHTLLPLMLTGMMNQVLSQGLYQLNQRANGF